MQDSHQAFLDDYFSRLDPKTILKREVDFESIDFEHTSPDDLYSALMFVVSPDKKEGGASRQVFLTDTRLIPRGTHLWRGRTLDTSDTKIPLRGMNKPADLWQPPASFVKSAGRLNKPGEPLLYTAYKNPDAVPDEIRVRDGEKFALIKYVTTADLSLTAIGLPIRTETLSPEAAVGATAVSNFFGRQFTRRVTTEGGDTYALSELIAKYNYDLPPEIHNGWIYPSVEKPNSLNVTVRPHEAHSSLSVLGVAICSVKRGALRSMLNGWMYSSANAQDGDFRWFTQGSDFQKAFFSEFQPQ